MSNTLKKTTEKKILLIVATLSYFISFLQADNNILIYNAYGNDKKIIIEGRMVDKKDYKSASKDDNLLHNIWRKMKQLSNDEIKNREIIAKINNIRYTTNGDEEGYFEFDIQTDYKLKRGYTPLTLQIDENPKILNTHATIITDKAIGIISDFDDTVIISNVANKLKLANNLLLKNHKQREVIPTMVERFRKILAQNSPTTPTTLFFVTGSPKQLFNSIERFLNYHKFPKHILITKQLHGYDNDPLFDQFEYKIQKIEELFGLYPNMQWIMFGDSGEKDREVYEYLSKKYPLKVQSYYIRDVHSGKIEKIKGKQ